MKDFIKVLLYIWQLPQNLLGLLLFRWYGHDDAIRGEHRRAKVLYSQKMSFGTISYYSFFTERWADRLGGVRR